MIKIFKYKFYTKEELRLQQLVENRTMLLEDSETREAKLKQLLRERTKALTAIEDEYNDEIKSKYNSFTPIKKYKQAKQDGHNLYRLYHNFVHKLTEEQKEIYQNLNSYKGKNIKGLVREYMMLNFAYLRDLEERWESPEELIRLRQASSTNTLYNDCDGRALDMYYFLKANDCEDEFYLQVVDTILERHMNLIFWNKEVDDYCTIESTVWANDWERIADLPARSQAYSKPIVIFDDESEYRCNWME